MGRGTRTLTPSSEIGATHWATAAAGKGASGREENGGGPAFPGSNPWPGPYTHGPRVRAPGSPRATGRAPYSNSESGIKWIKQNKTKRHLRPRQAAADRTPVIPGAGTAPRSLLTRCHAVYLADKYISHSHSQKAPRGSCPRGLRPRKAKVKSWARRGEPGCAVAEQADASGTEPRALGGAHSARRRAQPDARN